MIKKGVYTIHDDTLASQDVQGVFYDFDTYAALMEKAVLASPILSKTVEGASPSNVYRRAVVTSDGNLSFEPGPDQINIIHRRYDSQLREDVYYARSVSGRNVPHIRLSGHMAKQGIDGLFTPTETKTQFLNAGHDIVKMDALPRLDFMRDALSADSFGLMHNAAPLDSAVEFLDVRSVGGGVGGTLSVSGATATLTFSEKQKAKPILFPVLQNTAVFAYLDIVEITDTQAVFRWLTGPDTPITLEGRLIAVTGILFPDSHATPAPLPAILPRRDVFSVALGSTVTGNILANDIGTGLVVTKINGVEANVGTEFRLDAGGYLTVAEDGALTYDPRDDELFADVVGGRSKGVAATYTVSSGETEAEGYIIITVTARPMTITLDDEYVISLTTSGMINIFTQENNPHDVITITKFNGQNLVGGRLVTNISFRMNYEDHLMKMTVLNDGTIQNGTIYSSYGYDEVTRTVQISFTDGNTEYDTNITFKMVDASKIVVTPDVVSIPVSSAVTGNVLENDEGQVLYISDVNGSVSNVGKEFPLKEKGGSTIGTVTLNEDGTYTANNFGYDNIADTRGMPVIIKYTVKSRLNTNLKKASTLTVTVYGNKVPLIVRDVIATSIMGLMPDKVNLLENSTGKNMEVVSFNNIKFDGDEPPEFHAYYDEENPWEGSYIYLEAKKYGLLVHKQSQGKPTWPDTMKYIIPFAVTDGIVTASANYVLTITPNSVKEPFTQDMNIGVAFISTLANVEYSEPVDYMGPLIRSHGGYYSSYADAVAVEGGEIGEPFVGENGLVSFTVDSSRLYYSPTPEALGRHGESDSVKITFEVHVSGRTYTISGTYTVTIYDDVQPLVGPDDVTVILPEYDAITPAHLTVDVSSYMESGFKPIITKVVGVTETESHSTAVVCTDYDKISASFKENSPELVLTVHDDMSIYNTETKTGKLIVSLKAGLGDSTKDVTVNITKPGDRVVFEFGDYTQFANIAHTPKYDGKIHMRGFNSITEINGDANNIGVEIAGSNGGTFKVNSDGTYQFNAGSDFETVPKKTTITFKADSIFNEVSDGTLILNVVSELSEYEQAIMDHNPILYYPMRAYETTANENEIVVKDRVGNRTMTIPNFRKWVDGFGNRKMIECYAHDVLALSDYEQPDGGPYLDTFAMIMSINTTTLQNDEVLNIRYYHQYETVSYFTSIELFISYSSYYGHRFTMENNSRRVYSATLGTNAVWHLALNTQVYGNDYYMQFYINGRMRGEIIIQKPHPELKFDRISIFSNREYSPLQMGLSDVAVFLGKKFTAHEIATLYEKAGD